MYFEIVYHLQFNRPSAYLSGLEPVAMCLAESTRVFTTQCQILCAERHLFQVCSCLFTIPSPRCRSIDPPIDSMIKACSVMTQPPRTALLIVS